jgi:hypothetical protein
MKWPWHEKQAKRGHECRSRAFPAARPARRAGPRARRKQPTPRAAASAATPPISRGYLSWPAVPPAISVHSPHSAWPLRQDSASHADSLSCHEGGAGVRENRNSEVGHRRHGLSNRCDHRRARGACAALTAPYPPGARFPAAAPWAFPALARRTLEIVVVIVEYCRAEIAVAAGVGESGGVGLIPGFRRG